MPPQKSALWNYFNRSLNGNTVKCTLCDAQLTFCGVTTNLTSFSVNLQTSLKLKTSQSYKVICSTSLTQKNPHSTKYPRLSVIAKRVLAVPTTSFPSERIFIPPATKLQEGMLVSPCPSVCPSVQTNHMSYNNLSCVSQNHLKKIQLFTDEERRIPFIFDDFHLPFQSYWT